jgi:hypothetical protein
MFKKSIIEPVQSDNAGLLGTNDSAIRCYVIWHHIRANISEQPASSFFWVGVTSNLNVEKEGSSKTLVTNYRTLYVIFISTAMRSFRSQTLMRFLISYRKVRLVASWEVTLKGLMTLNQIVKDSGCEDADSTEHSTGYLEIFTLVSGGY